MLLLLRRPSAQQVPRPRTVILTRTTFHCSNSVCVLLFVVVSEPNVLPPCFRIFSKMHGGQRCGLHRGKPAPSGATDNSPARSRRRAQRAESKCRVGWPTTPILTAVGRSGADRGPRRARFSRAGAGRRSDMRKKHFQCALATALGLEASRGDHRYATKNILRYGNNTFP
jgi:hypothetical protein